VVAAPDTAGWYPVITNQLSLAVFALGLSSATVSTTRLFVTDAYVAPYSDTELALVTPEYIGSTTIQRSGTITPGFGPPALGDQLYSNSATGTFAAGTTILFNNVFGSPYASGFIYLTSIDWTFNASAIAATSWSLALQAVSGQSLWNFNFGSGVNAQFTGVTAHLVQMGSMNLRIDATQTWQIKLVATGGSVGPMFTEPNMAYSVNPN
jgi:hypothetical protein